MKGIDFLKGFNELAEDIVLEAKKPEQYKKQKSSKGNIIKFAGVAAVVALLVGMVAAGKMGILNKNTGMSIRNNRRGFNDLEDMQVLDIRAYTNLEVVTDRTRFTPATQDQSYNPETDMNMCYSIADIGENVYIAKEDGELETGDLFVFQKGSGTAALACGKSDCEHKIEAGGECEANLRVLDADVGRIQYYKGDLYYSLGDYKASILYKMSINTKTKQKYVSLLGEKESGSGGWLIHRGYIYFVSSGDGFYRMPVDNPKQKEQLITLPEDGGIGFLKASGSYIYFVFSKREFEAFARYNIESGQIEQFTDMTKQYMTNAFQVNNGKVYFTEKVDSFQTIFCYDISTGEKQAFLPEETQKKNTEFTISSADLDYIYVREAACVWDGQYRREADVRIYAYTWDGVFAGELPLSTGFSYSGEVKPFQVFHHESSAEIGSDSDRIYYLGEIYDTQANEYGTNSNNYVEGTGKTVISYINKSELSAEGGIPQKYTACEIDYKE